MREVITKLYRFSELSDKAKAAAITTAQSENDPVYVWERDAFKSLEALVEKFGFEITTLYVDWLGHRKMFRIKPKDGVVLPTGAALDALIESLGRYNPETLKGLGDCKLTGYTADDDAIDGLRIAYKRDNVKGIWELLQAAFETWLAACRADCEGFYTDAQFSEHCDANDQWFTEDGARSYL